MAALDLGPRDTRFQNDAFIRVETENGRRVCRNVGMEGHF